jgi:phosphinothricin acetyltransferase
MIRRAELADAADIAAIYNEAILTPTATFDIEPKCVEDRAAWFEARDGALPH